MNVPLTPDSLKMFTGGALQTNAYLLACPDGNILIDAPEGTANAMRNIPISLLVLTHGHYDHVWDAAEIARIHNCPVAMHATTEEMLADRNLLRRFGLDLEVEPVAASHLLKEGKKARGCWDRLSICLKFRDTVPAVYVSILKQVACSSAAMCFLPEG